MQKEHPMGALFLYLNHGGDIKNNWRKSLFTLMF